MRWPTLSSISLPTRRLGFEAAMLLARILDGGKAGPPHRKLLPNGIIARASTDTVAVQDPLVKSTGQYIRANAGKPIGVDQVAQALQVSRRTLGRRFSNAMGRTARDELARTRMLHAHRLLADESQSIAAVAQSCGYGSPSSFSRSFHRHSGLWPSEYRERLRTE